jgi:hypothetical protein
MIKGAMPENPDAVDYDDDDERRGGGGGGGSDGEHAASSDPHDASAGTLEIARIDAELAAVSQARAAAEDDVKNAASASSPSPSSSSASQPPKLSSVGSKRDQYQPLTDATRPVRGRGRGRGRGGGGGGGGGRAGQPDVPLSPRAPRLPSAASLDDDDNNNVGNARVRGVQALHADPNDLPDPSGAGSPGRLAQNIAAFNQSPLSNNNNNANNGSGASFAPQTNNNGSGAGFGQFDMQAMQQQQPAASSGVPFGGSLSPRNAHRAAPFAAGNTPISPQMPRRGGGTFCNRRVCVFLIVCDARDCE